MMRKIFAFSFALALPVSVFACELPKNEPIKVGCTYTCDFLYRYRVIYTAWAMGYSTQFVHLNEKPDMKKAMSEVDAILVPGGADIDPKYYLEKVTPELREYTKENINLVKFSDEGKKRDPYEYKLIQTYSSDETYKKLPMLGICRGMQMMSVAQGIPLYLDIRTEIGIKNRKNLFDRISPDADNKSLIQALYNSETFKGFKLHHQGIRVPYYNDHESEYPLAKVTAHSNNRTIAESIEYVHRPALGIQYHPERSFTGTSAPVFRWFLTKACEYKKSRKVQ